MLHWRHPIVDVETIADEIFVFHDRRLSRLSGAVAVVWLMLARPRTRGWLLAHLEEELAVTAHVAQSLLEDALRQLSGEGLVGGGVWGAVRSRL